MPDDSPQTTGSEVQMFVENTLKEIYTGVENSKSKIVDPVKFELEVTEKQETEGSGGFKQFIRIGKKKEGESTQKISFSAKPDYFAEKVSPHAHRRPL